LKQSDTFTFEKQSLEQFEKIDNLNNNIQEISSELEDEVVNNLDEDQILFEDKKTQLKTIVKQEKLKKGVEES
jgi:hypothetical protein